MREALGYLSTAGTAPAELDGFSSKTLNWRHLCLACVSSGSRLVVLILQSPACDHVCGTPDTPGMPPFVGGLPHVKSLPCVQTALPTQPSAMLQFQRFRALCSNRAKSVY